MELSKKAIFTIIFGAVLIFSFKAIEDLSYVIVAIAPDQGPSWYFVALVAVVCLIIGVWALGCWIIKRYSPTPPMKKEVERLEPEIDYTLPPQMQYGIPSSLRPIGSPPPIRNLLEASKPAQPPEVTLPPGLIPKPRDLQLEALKLQLANTQTNLLKYQQMALQAQDTNIQQANEVAALLGVERDFSDAVTEVGLAWEFDIAKIKGGLETKKSL